MNVKQGKSKATEAEFPGNGYKNNSWSKDAEYCKKKKKNGEEDVKVAVKTLSGEGGTKENGGVEQKPRIKEGCNDGIVGIVGVVMMVGVVVIVVTNGGGGDCGS